jgi:hypothetical protein
MDLIQMDLIYTASQLHMPQWLDPYPIIDRVLIGKAIIHLHLPPKEH